MVCKDEPLWTYGSILKLILPLKAQMTGLKAISLGLHFLPSELGCSKLTTSLVNDSFKFQT